MKKSVFTFLIMMLIPICCFSQSTYPQKLNDSLVVITSTQLKQTNLIFAEHKYLKQSNNILKDQISNYKSIIINNNKIDSLNYERESALMQQLSNKNWIVIKYSILSFILGGIVGWLAF